MSLDIKTQENCIDLINEENRLEIVVLTISLDRFNLTRFVLSDRRDPDISRNDFTVRFDSVLFHRLDPLFGIPNLISLMDI